MNNAFFFLIASMISLGISNLFFEKSTKIIGPINTTWWYYFFGLILATLFYLVSDKTPITDYKTIKWPFLIALFLVFSVYLFNIALQKINISIASTLRSLAFIVTILLNIYLSKDPLSYKQIVGILVGICSILLVK